MPPRSTSPDPSADTSEGRLRDLLALSSDWFWEQDAEFRFTYMSDGLLAISGVKTSSTIFVSSGSTPGPSRA